MAIRKCLWCGGECLIGLRGRRRQYCSDACRNKAHRRRRQGALGRRVPVASPPMPTLGFQVTTSGHLGDGMARWASWVRGAYLLDATGEEILRLILEADERYRQARDVLAVEGMVINGRAHPAIAVERDTRAAIQRLIAALELEDTDETATAPAEVKRFPRGA